MPSTFEGYRVVYSFALKSTDETAQLKLIQESEKLKRIGQFCLREIVSVIPLPDRQLKKPELKLVINNIGEA
jgi:hypothetical protein